MNRTLIVAAAAASLAMPFPAAADIKIFGVIQAETGNVDVNTSGPGVDTSTTLTGTGSNGAIHGGGPNRIGFKGSEKLGNGLTAYFKISTRFATFDDRGNGSEERDTYVGVKGDGWHVQFGRMNSLYKTASHKHDPFVTTGLQQRSTGAISNLHHNYVNDIGEIGFKSGVWSGGLQIQWEDGTDAGGRTSGTSVGPVDSGSWIGRVQYKTAVWKTNFSYANQEYSNAADVSGVRAWKIASRWMASDHLTVSAQYEDLNASSVDEGSTTVRTEGRGAGSFFVRRAGPEGLVECPDPDGSGPRVAPDCPGQSSIEDYNSLAVYASYKLSPSTSLHGTYADAEIERVTSIDTDIDQWALGLTHRFTKRTSVFGGYTDVEYDTGGDTPSQEIDIWSLGVRHKF